MHLRGILEDKYSKRNSNIELLRIISMIMILGLHVNVYSLGIPTEEECLASPLSSFTRCAFEMICIIAVNLFVLISGWFSIQIKFKNFARFVFQCVFILTSVYLLGVFIGEATFNSAEILQCGFFLGNAWFVTSYIGLYILAPFLNKYCEQASEINLRYILILFYIFQTLYGNLFQATSIFVGGYSTFSFIGLYVLARYLRKYGTKIFKFGGLIYCASLFGLIMWYWFSVKFGLYYLANMAFLYTCPLNISASCGLLFCALRIKEKNFKIINFIASSVFSVYLCHICNTWTANFYITEARNIFKNYSGLKYWLIILSFILFVFVFSIGIDQIRKGSWRLFNKYILNSVILLRSSKI